MLEVADHISVWTSISGTVLAGGFTSDFGAELARVLGRFFVVPLVPSVLATLLWSRRLDAPHLGWKIIGSFIASFLIASIFWAALMLTIAGGIFDQSFWY